MNRPEVTIGCTVTSKTGCGKHRTIINVDPGDLQPVELFATIGKCGGCALAQNEAIGRIISSTLQFMPKDVDRIAYLEVLAKQLTGIQCQVPTWDGNGGQNLSCADVIGKRLKDFCAAYRSGSPKNPMDILASILNLKNEAA